MSKDGLYPDVELHLAKNTMRLQEDHIFNLERIVDDLKKALERESFLRREATIRLNQPQEEDADDDEVTTNEEVVYESELGPYIVQIFSTLMYTKQGAPHLATSLMYPDMPRDDKWYSVARFLSLDEAKQYADNEATSNVKVRVIYDPEYPVG